jgi:hypothetical protein
VGVNRRLRGGGRWVSKPRRGLGLGILPPAGESSSSLSRSSGARTFWPMKEHFEAVVVTQYQHMDAAPFGFHLTRREGWSAEDALSQALMWLGSLHTSQIRVTNRRFRQDVGTIS